MPRFTRLLGLVAFPLLAPLAHGNIDPEPENRSPMTAMPGRFGALFGGASSEATGGDFTWAQVTLQGGFARRKKFTHDLTMFYGLAYRYTDIDQGAMPMGSVLGDLHDITLPLSFVYQREGSPWSFAGQVAGQISSDFSSITGDDLDYTMRLGGAYKFNDEFSLNFGVARIRNWTEAIILPAIGFVWQPRDDWSFTLLGPRITLSHRINESWILRAGGFPTGGRWNIEDENGDSADYGFGVYNAGVGLDFKLRHGIWLTVWGGASFGGELRAEMNDDTLFEDELETGFFTYVGINLYEW